ncbi:MAG: hypothetical protein IPO71_05745 [Nitrosomonas sp.]|nr:hypothetical protein [Nitrosomonas sp.]
MNGSTRQLQAAPEEELLLQGGIRPQSPVQRATICCQAQQHRPAGQPQERHRSASALLELELPL